MNQYAAAVLLRHTDGRSHSVAVVNTCPSPEHAITCAEASALKTVAPEEGWSVESSWLFDQHLIDAEFRPVVRHKPCGRRLAAGQHWQFCGETDMGQTAPALCHECQPGGLTLHQDPAEDWPNAHGRRLNENLEAY